MVCFASFRAAKIVKICVNTKFFCNSWHISVIFSTFAGEMKRVGIVIIVFALCMVLPIHAESFSLDEILEDIYNQLSEDGEVPMEDIQEELMEIAENPIDLNHTTADELSRLYFLSDEQIDAILLYQYKHPFNDIYELQLIDCLKDYEIRNLLPFVKVEAKGERLEVKGKNLYFREVFHYAKHEIT